MYSKRIDVLKEDRNTQIGYMYSKRIDVLKEDRCSQRG